VFLARGDTLHVAQSDDEVRDVVVEVVVLQPEGDAHHAHRLLDVLRLRLSQEERIDRLLDALPTRCRP
jgi:hypothetical protein